MHVVEITEGAAVDRQVRNVARHIIADVTREAGKALEIGAIEFSDDHGDRAALPVGYMTTMLPDLVVGFVSGIPNQMLIDRRRYKALLPAEVRYIIAYPAPVCPPEVYQKPLEQVAAIAKRYVPRSGQPLAQELRSAPEWFIHEFIHYADSAKAAGNLPASGDLTPTRYYNSSPEVNAYFNQALAHLDAHSDAWWHRDFETVLRDMIRELEPDFVAVLRRGNQRRLIKRFYSLWKFKQLAGQHDFER
jgi:hypothetical protein